ncbi:hypothetical protein GALL_493840 [mine drainage metagenome]|uniref:NolW-like domain-containing protein n=1 Tax=mine drainage metagenome TaxID=410659 RepID=A0A1J5PUQ8_9ZZZZ
MRRVIPAMIIGMGLSHAAWAAAPASDIVLDLDRVKVSELTAVAYSYALTEPYVLAPELVGDDRLVSARIVARPNEFRARFVQYMATLGYTVSKVSGVDQVARTPEPKAPPPPPLETLVYRPQFRDPTYLAELLKPLFDKGGFTISRKITAPAGSEATGVAPSGSAAAMVDRAGVDTLVFAGTGEDVRRLKELLPQVDTRPGEIYVEATVYEVNTGNSEGSAFELALNLLGSRVGFSTPKSSMDGASSFSIATAGVNAVFQILSQDQRFHVLDRPSGRVMSGKTTRLSGSCPQAWCNSAWPS